MLLILAASRGSTCPSVVANEGGSKPEVSEVGSSANLLKCQPFVVLYRMDRAGNGNGILEPDEIPRGAESFVQRLVSESKVASPDSTPLRQLAVAWHHRASSRTPRILRSVVIQPDRSRSRRDNSLASHRDHAASFLKLYDGNGNGSLEQNEWERIGAGWRDVDTDRNGVLSFEEVSERFAAYERPPAETGDDSTEGGSSDVSKNRRLSPYAQRQRAGALPLVRRRSYRRRTPHERLPAGIPGWYIQKDADRDGQIMMVEYAKGWNDERLAEFNRYDFNRDGIITPEECLKAESQR